MGGLGDKYGVGGLWESNSLIVRGFRDFEVFIICIVKDALNRSKVTLNLNTPG